MPSLLAKLACDFANNKPIWGCNNKANLDEATGVPFCMYLIKMQSDTQLQKQFQMLARDCLDSCQHFRAIQLILLLLKLLKLQTGITRCNLGASVSYVIITHLSNILKVCCYIPKQK